MCTQYSDVHSENSQRWNIYRIRINQNVHIMKSVRYWYSCSNTPRWFYVWSTKDIYFFHSHRFHCSIFNAFSSPRLHWRLCRWGHNGEKRLQSSCNSKHPIPLHSVQIKLKNACEKSSRLNWLFCFSTAVWNFHLSTIVEISIFDCNHLFTFTQRLQNP